MANILQQLLDRNLVKVLLEQCTVDPIQTYVPYAFRKHQKTRCFLCSQGGIKTILARDEVILKISSDRQLRVSNHK